MLVAPVLIIDAYNTFMRSYCAYPAMSPEGEQVGGVVGFVKTLRRLVDEIKPTKVFIVWEGGGSSRRRSLYKDYKAQRKPGKLNRFYEDDIPDTDENKLKQVANLVGVLKSLPVCQLYVSDVEADDVIAYMVKHTFSDVNKVILSTDKDMLQLLDDKTETYNLNKKAYVTQESVIQEFSIPPRNFALAKTICGDGSDNIPGIRGVGFKTAAKKFPLLQQDQDVLLADIINYAAARCNEGAVYKTVAQSADMLRRNWRLVYLDGSMLPAASITRLETIIAGWSPTLDKVGLIRAAGNCGVLNHIDVDGTLYTLRPLHYTFEKAKE